MGFCFVYECSQDSLHCDALSHAFVFGADDFTAVGATVAVCTVVTAGLVVTFCADADATGGTGSGTLSSGFPLCLLVVPFILVC